MLWLHSVELLDYFEVDLLFVAGRTVIVAWTTRYIRLHCIPCPTGLRLCACFIHGSDLAIKFRGVCIEFGTIFLHLFLSMVLSIGLVVSVLDFQSRGSGFNSQPWPKFDSRILIHLCPGLLNYDEYSYSRLSVGR